MRCTIEDEYFVGDGAEIFPLQRFFMITDSNLMHSVTLLQGIRILYYATNMTTSHAIEQNAKARKLQMIGASLFVSTLLCALFLFD